MRWRRSCEILVAVASVTLTLATAAAIRPRDLPAGLVLVAAVAWGALAYACELGAGRTPPPSAPTRRGGGVTTVVRLGEESDAVARASIVVAANVGPAVVLATRDRRLLAELQSSVGVEVHVAPTLEDALIEALPTITTDAMLIASASAFPAAEAFSHTASLLTDDIGWAFGRTSSINEDRFAPAEREELRSRVRSRLRCAGAEIWEPDGTIVRSDLVRAHPFEAGKPWGQWLRARRREGFHGVETSAIVTHRSAPADAPAFWPSELMRQRAAAVDLAGALRVGPIRTRLATAGALGRELFGYPVALWLAAPLVIAGAGRFPLRFPQLPWVAAVAMLAAARWALTRAEYGIGLHPLREARAAAYDAPGSLLALPSVLSGRVRRIRFRIPDQPLLVAAVLLTVLTTLVIVDRGTEATHVVQIAAALAVVELVAMWALAVRAVGKRAWERGSYRVPIDLEVHVAGAPARTVNGSAVGLAAMGDLPHFERGSAVPVSVTCPDGTELELQGVIRSDRQTREGRLLGLELRAEPPEHARWIIALLSAQSMSGPGSNRAPRTRIDRVVSFELAAVGVVAVLALALLTVVGFGYRPLVVRSASMVPTLGVGDVVVAEPVHVDQLHRGDIVTLPNGSGELLTHRVRTVTRTGGAIRIETRGDANHSSEFFTLAPRTSVGRVAFTAPVIGRILVALGAPAVRWLLGLACAALVLLAVATSVPRRPRRAGPEPVQ